MKYYISTFGVAYGACNYGDANYQDNATTCGTSAGGAPTTVPTVPPSSVLTNTGFDILLAGTIACVIIFGALLVRFARKPKKASPSPKI